MKALSACGLKVRANLDVVGWSPDQCLLNEALAEDVVRYVEGALLTGLGPSEIESDLCEAWGHAFTQISVEVTRSFRRASALVYAVAAPGIPMRGQRVTGTAVA